MRQRRRHNGHKGRQNGSVAHTQPPKYKLANDLSTSKCTLQRLHSTQHKQLQDVQTEEREMLEAKSLPLQNYLMRHVMPTLTQGLIEVCKTKPQDPVDYLVCDNTHVSLLVSLSLLSTYRLSSSLRTIHRLTDILIVFISPTYIFCVRMRTCTTIVEHV